MRFFVSYAHADKDKVARLVKLMSRGGHSLWFDVELRAGPPWKDQLHQAIVINEALLYIATSESANSEWCQWELATAIAAGKPIIPVLLEKVDPPSLIKDIQYADLSSGLNAPDIAKLLGDIRQLETIIPVDQALPALDDPKGLPAQAPQSAFSTLVVGNGNTFTNIKEQNVTNNFTSSKKEKTWNSAVIVGTALGILALIATVLIGILTALPEDQREGILFSVGLVPPSPTPTATPTLEPSATPTPVPPMRAGDFNVVVAGFGFLQEDGSVVQSQVADNISDLVYDAMTELAQVKNMRGRLGDGVGYILGQSAQEREQQAAQIAQSLNASIVIYGLVSNKGNGSGLLNVFEPEFYIDSSLVSFEPELAGSDRLGDPVEFVGISGATITDRIPLQKRIEVLQYFIRGLSQFISGNFQQARGNFEEALNVESDGLEVLNIFAGNAAIRQPDSAAALEFYDSALQARPDYARGLVGRGITLFQMTQQITPLPVFDRTAVLDTKQDCNDINKSLPNSPQLLAELALRCFREAEISQDTLPTADIEFKISFGIGQIHIWQSQNRYGNRWEEARTALQNVVDLYEKATPEKQLRIRSQAAHSYAWLGLRLITLYGSDVKSVEEALDNYKMAQALLLQDDANRAYNQTWIDLYGEQINSLEDFLDSLSQSPLTTTPISAITSTPETV